MFSKWWPIVFWSVQKNLRSEQRLASGITQQSWLRAVLLFGGYFALAELGMWLAVPPFYSAPIWPATGLAVYCLSLWGRRYCYVIWLAAWSADMLHKTWITGHAAEPELLLVTGATALGSLLMALVSVILLQPLMLERTRRLGEGRIIWRLFLAVPVAAALSATPGIVSLQWYQPQSEGVLIGNWLTLDVGMSGVVCGRALYSQRQYHG
ncbi:hypothetical protein PU634_02545 [Oceanimonas pelagia]|uniref:MASE1 domain-containing protein n=1 Tax=Oceanimonas pelagia TaxID=3028314 RepID=A0AA50KPC9_9GAMM|nr:MASE1 domain-containing protein [Oceanimonas pelagia]WMC11264.1 hypothetical protein PU634_02545 [Oceanimonas pelagia]